VPSGYITRAVEYRLSDLVEENKSSACETGKFPS
jgi:hypothetical protein